MAHTKIIIMHESNNKCESQANQMLGRIDESSRNILFGSSSKFGTATIILLGKLCICFVVALKLA